jgi:Domain of unknown function (DUF5666)
MKTATAAHPRRGVPRALLTFFLVAMPSLLAGCGSGGSGGPVGPERGKDTNVVVLLTSTANDQLSDFGLSIESVLLADKAGNTVTLYANTGDGLFGPAEFMHLNGASEPLVTVSVPQGVYTSAIVTVGGCAFETVIFTTNLNTDIYAEGLCGQGTGDTTVNLSSSITISGAAMVLSLNLQVPQSYTLIGSQAAPPDTYTISPVFTLTPVTISSQPTNHQNGKLTGIEAQVVSIDATGNSFAVQTISRVSLQLQSNSSTTFQGVAGLASLEAGMLVNIDVAIQPDGSLLATRVEVDDSAAPAVFVGPWIAPTAQSNVFVILPVGCFPMPDNPVCDSVVQSTGNTVFSVSGQFSNVASLPFPASFSSSSVVLGQNVSSFSLGVRNVQGVPIATTVMLVPQTINGTVTAMSNSNGFAVYTVTLAPYDLIPTLQASLGPLANLNSPATVVVYADTSVQFLNSAPVSSGSVFRFRGLIFNDNGTLRMDCEEVLDGVPE